RTSRCGRSRKAIPQIEVRVGAIPARPQSSRRCVAGARPAATRPVLARVQISRAPGGLPRRGPPGSSETQRLASGRAAAAEPAGFFPPPPAAAPREGPLARRVPTEVRRLYRLMAEALWFRSTGPPPQSTRIVPQSVLLRMAPGQPELRRQRARSA